MVILLKFYIEKIIHLLAEKETPRHRSIRGTTLSTILAEELAIHAAATVVAEHGIICCVCVSGYRDIMRRWFRSV